MIQKKKNLQNAPLWDSDLVTFPAQHTSHTDNILVYVLKHMRYVSLSQLIPQVLDNTGDVNPVEVVVPVYALGIKTKLIIFPVLPVIIVVVVVVRHRRPQPLRVGVIKASHQKKNCKKQWARDHPKMQKK